MPAPISSTSWLACEIAYCRRYDETLHRGELVARIDAAGLDPVGAALVAEGRAHLVTVLSARSGSRVLALNLLERTGGNPGRSIAAAVGRPLALCCPWSGPMMATASPLVEPVPSGYCGTGQSPAAGRSGATASTVSATPW